MKITFLGTGAGNSTLRAHTGMALECPDGTKLLLDTSSGNSALRSAAAVGLELKEFEDVLLSHDHPDHMGGIDFIEFNRALSGEQYGPLRVHASYEALEGLKRHSITTRLNIRDISGDFGRNYEGRELLHWQPVDHGRVIELGPRTTAWHFEADHITGASGWRVECDGKAVVFSGDTRYSPEVAKAAEGADLLIHEAFCVSDSVLASNAGHCTGGEAGQVAAEARVASLVLTHLTDAYHLDPEPLGVEAAQFYAGPITMAHDCMQITLG
jgi:ribonuclease Z